MPAAILALDLLDLVTTNRHDVTGTAFAQNAIVEKITEKVTADGYVVEISVSPIAATQYWVLGTSALGSTTRLTF